MSAGSKLSDFFAIIKQTILAAHKPTCIDGIIKPGSYNPAEGTVDVYVTKTIAYDQPLLIPMVPLQAPVHGDQAGPVGGESVVLERGEGGWLAKPMHIPTDSPGAPAGERWILSPSRDGSSIKLTKANSGTVAIVGKGQTTTNAPTVTSTATGTNTVHGTTTNVTATGTTTVSGTTTNVTGTTVSVTGGSVQIGPNGGPYLNFGGAGYGSGYALVRVVDLAALLSWLSTHVHGNGNGGSPTTSPTTSPPAVTGSSEFTLGE